MAEHRDELTTLVLICEKLLSLAEAQAETDLADMRSRQRFRRENAEQLDRIEDAVKRLKTSSVEKSGSDESTALTRGEAKILLSKAWPVLVAALTGLASYIAARFFH